MRIAVVLVVVLGLVTPLAAQTRRTATRDEPAVSFRGFFLASGEQLAAGKTFDAVLGAQSMRPFWGGGAQVNFRRGLFAEIAVSRFSSTGARAFVVDGQVIPVGIPLTLALTPIEVTGGYRFQVSRRVVPYAAAGVGRYQYTETSSFSESSENIDASYAGFVVQGGVEIRLHPWIGAGVDAQYTRVGGVLGVAGISKEFGEDDLGGAALRVKILVGR